MRADIITVGARRAGKNISDRFRRVLPNLPESNADTLAEIIDKETYASELLYSLRETVRALEAHLAESTRDHNLGNVDLLCPCSTNEVARAKALIAKVEGVA